MGLRSSEAGQFWRLLARRSADPDVREYAQQRLVAVQLAGRATDAFYSGVGRVAERYRQRRTG